MHKTRASEPVNAWSVHRFAHNREGFVMTGKVLFAMGLLAMGAQVALAGRPLETNDAGAVDTGVFELEGAVGYVHDSGSDEWEVPLALTYGLVPNIEIGIGLGYGSERTEHEDGSRDWDSSWTDFEIGGKWQFLSQDKAFIDQGISICAALPVDDEDRHINDGDIDYDITWIGVRQINEKWAVLVNVGYTFVGNSGKSDEAYEGASDVIHYSIGTTYQWTDTLQPVAEILFETPVEGGPTDAGANVGLRWQAREDLMIDFAVGTHLNGQWPDLTATTGFTWDF